MIYSQINEKEMQYVVYRKDQQGNRLIVGYVYAEEGKAAEKVHDRWKDRNYALYFYPAHLGNAI